MRTQVSFAVMVILLLAALPALAADSAATAPTDDQQYEAIAAARTKAELALRRIDKTLGDAQTQWQINSNLLDQTRMRIDQILNKARDAESRKDDNDRSQAYLDELRDRSEQLADEWQKFVADDRSRMEESFRRSQEIVADLNGVLPNIAAMEHTYKDLDMNLDTVRGIYETIAAKADEAYDMGSKALSDLADARKFWTTALIDARTLAKERTKKDKGIP